MRKPARSDVGPGACMPLNGQTAECLTVVREVSEIEPFVDGWNRLALLARTPFLTCEWLRAWWETHGEGGLEWLILHDSEGVVHAGACCGRPDRRTLSAAANSHSGSWDVVAVDDRARVEIWRRLAERSPGHLRLRGLVDASGPTAAGLDVLGQRGYRLGRERGAQSPFMRLPRTWDEMMARVSKNLRSQVGRRRRALERAGTLVFRTTSDGPGLEADLETIFRLEAAGWKGRSATAVLSDERTRSLYAGFARAAAQRGWLRLHVLELDGAPIAADYGCVFANGGFLVKTAFDERHAQLSPGLVLRAEVLKHAIGEGLDFYDFLGGADAYKLRWTDEVRPRVTIDAYRGLAALRPSAVYRWGVREALKSTRKRLPQRGRQAGRQGQGGGRGR